MHRRHGDVLAGNGEGIVLRGRAGERHILRSPLLEGNGLTALTRLGVGRDVHRVVLKEISAAIRILDAGAGDRAVLDRHGTGLTVAVGGVAVGPIHIDCVGGGVKACSSQNGTAGIIGIGTVLLPLDLHLADLGQGWSSYRINAIAVCTILTGVCHIDFDLTGGVDGYIFDCIQTVAVATVNSSIVRRSAGDVHGGIFGDGDVFLRLNAVGFLIAVHAVVCHVDGHFGIAHDRHIAGGIAAR